MAYNIWKTIACRREARRLPAAVPRWRRRSKGARHVALAQAPDLREELDHPRCIGILVVIAIGGLVEIAPLFYLKSTIEKVEGVRPYTPLELAGRNIYVREGCYNCHSQMIRPLRDEVERYGHYSLAAESMYDQPVPVGLEAHRARSRPRRRQVLRRLAARPSDAIRARWCRLDHAGAIPGSRRPSSTIAHIDDDLKRPGRARRALHATR